MIKILNMNSRQDRLIDYLQDRHPKVRFFKMERNQGNDTSEHLHADLFQITYCYSGSGIVRISPYDLPVEPNCFYVFKPQELHALLPAPGLDISNATCRFELTGFSGQLLRPMIRVDVADAADGEALLRKIYAEVTVGEPVNLIRAGLLLTELLLLLDSRCRADEKEKISPLVRRAIDYIGLRFRDGIGIEDVAQEMNVSASHLCRAFRRETDSTPLAYLQRVRLGYALERLFTTRMKIGDIALEAGFENTKNLNMAFRRVHNMSATEFRRHHLEKNPLTGDELSE